VQLGTTQEKLKAVGVETMAVVNTPLPRARLYFKYRPARVLLGAGQRHEIDVVDRHAGAASRITVDEIDQRIADALDRRDVELHRSRVRFHAPGALLDGAPVRKRGIADAKRDGADRWTVHSRKGLREAARLGVDDEVDLALTIEKHVLRTMLRDRLEAQLLEQPAERARIGRRVLDEFEAVGAERVVSELRLRAAHCRLPCVQRSIV